MIRRNLVYVSAGKISIGGSDRDSNEPRVRDRSARDVSSYQFVDQVEAPAAVEWVTLIFLITVVALKLFHLGSLLSKIRSLKL